MRIAPVDYDAEVATNTNDVTSPPQYYTSTNIITNQQQQLHATNLPPEGSDFVEIPMPTTQNDNNSNIKGGRMSAPKRNQILDPSYSRKEGGRKGILYWMFHKFVSMVVALFIFCAALSQLICELVVYPNEDVYSPIQLIPRLTIYIPLVFAVFYYVILVVGSETCRYLLHNMKLSELEKHMKQISKEKPVISMRVLCYHYETRVITTANGNGGVTTRTITVRVNTYNETRLFTYQHFRELSKPFSLEETSKKYMKINLANIVFAKNTATKQALKQARASIQKDNLWRDVHMEYYENWRLPGFRKQVLAQMETKTKSFLFFNIFTYLIFSFLLLNGVYRIIFDYFCDTQEYQFVKEVSVVPFTEESVELKPSLWMNSKYGKLSYGEDFSFISQVQTNHQPEMSQPGIPISIQPHNLVH